jgi:4-amino-4-deoxychorismate lyase
MAEAETQRPNSPVIVFLDGQLVPATAARLSLDDAGVLYGLGFFETFRTSGGVPHHWSFHRERLAQACAAAGIRIPGTFLASDEARLRDSVGALLRENKVSEAVVRYTLTAGRAAADGVGESFAQPSEFMALRALPPAAPAEGISLRVLGLSRDNGEWLPRPKSLNYANALAGGEELRRRAASPSDEGLFLSRDERCVVETTRQNLAWIEEGKLCYPDPALGAVAGTCLQWALQRGIPSAPRRSTLDELRGRDAVIVLNAVRGVTPVRELWDANDQQRLATFASPTHPIVKELQRQWTDALQATARAKR